MRLFGIILAIFIGLLGLRLFFTGLKTFTLFFKTQSLTIEVRQIMFRDLAMGLLLMILAIAIIW